MAFSALKTLREYSRKAAKKARSPDTFVWHNHAYLTQFTHIDCKPLRLEYKCGFLLKDHCHWPNASGKMRFRLSPRTPALIGKNRFAGSIGLCLEMQGAFGQGGLDFLEVRDKASEFRSRESTRRPGRDLPDGLQLLHP